MKQVVATVISNEQLVSRTLRYPRNTLGSNLLWLHCPEIAQEAKPGQFAMVRCGEGGILPRPFSVHQIGEDGIAIFYTVWSGGKGTEWLAECRAGDTVELFGLLGNGFSVQPASHNLLLVAAGMGIAPLYFLAQRQSELGCSVTLLYGTRSEHRYPESLLPLGVKRVAATDDGSIGYHGLVTDLIRQYVNQADQIFACGPIGMYRTMAQMPELKSKAVEVSLEVRMGCGRGVCYGCAIKTKTGSKKVCTDGPVFALDEILWEELNLI